MPTKKAPQEAIPVPQAPAPKDSNSLAVLSMVFGLISLTGFGLIFGIPAIVLASIALKRNLPERGLSITGLVTGIASTVISVIFLILMIIGFVWAMNHPNEIEPRSNMPHGPQTEQRFESSRT